METSLIVAKAVRRISDKDFESIYDYLDSPADWHAKHGFAFKEVH